MNGVRIGMKKLPFKKRHFDKQANRAEMDSFLDIDKLYEENHMMIVAQQPTFLNVEYTEAQHLWSP